MSLKRTFVFLFTISLIVWGKTLSAQTQIPIVAITGVSPSWWALDGCAVNTVEGVSDGNYNTGNATNYGPAAYIIYDLGSVKSISEMEVAPQMCSWGVAYLNAAKVYGSTDNITYTLIGSIPNVTIGVMTPTELSFTARYVKIELSPNNYLAISELRFYGGDSNPAPTISSFTPANGVSGSTVTITGTNLTGANAVSFGGTAASSFTVVSATSITAVVGSGTTGSVSVTTPGGTATSAGTFTFQPVHFLASGAGTADANGVYIETGLNNNVSYYVKAGSPTMYLYRANDFYNGNIWFNGTVLGSTSTYSYYDMSTADTPAGILFDYDNWPTGNAPNPLISSPNPITNISPPSAIAGSTITLTGYYFTGATAVSIGGVAVASFSVVNSNSIIAVVANGNTGIVSVTTPNATMQSVGTFTQIFMPTISSFTPASAETGTTVTITGTNFTGATAVSFGGTAASSFTVVSSTSITAVVGNGATGNVSVTTAGGTATLAGFNYIGNISWTGTTSTAWNTGSNWSSGSVPTAVDNVTIPAAPSNQPVVNEAPGTPAACNDLTIAPGASVTIAPGKALTVNGTLANNAGISGLLLQSNAAGTASLLHNTAGVNASLQRYIPGSTELDDMVYHLVSVPLTPETNNTSNLFLGSYLYNFSESTNSWVIMGTPTNNIMDETRGYMVYYPGSSQTYNFSGPMNHNSFTALTTFTPGKSPKAGNYGLNLVPNPYPSAIDWDATSGWTKTNLFNAVYVWNSAVSTSNYASYVNGASTNGGSRYIAPGQAFFVGANNTNPVLTMSYDVRLHYAASFLKEQTAQNDMLLIHAEAGNKSDEAVVRFSNGATSGFDGEWDAYKMTGGESAPQLGSLTADGISLSINSLPLSGEPLSVPLTFSLYADAGARFSFSGLNTFTAYQAINLEDKHTGELIDLKQQSEYVFSHNAGNTAERFVLHFGSPASLEENENQNISTWFSGNTLYLSTPEQAGEKARIEVFNTSGQLLFSKDVTLNTLQQFDVSAKGTVITRVTLRIKVLNTKSIVF